MPTTLAIRAAEPDDLDSLTALYNHYVSSSPATFDIEPLSLDARREWMSHYAATGRHQLWVADRAGEVVGYTCSSVFRPKAAYRTSVETTVYVAQDAVGAGVGRALYAHLFERLRGEDLHRAFAGVTLPNAASEALHLEFGFERIGVFEQAGRKFDRYWDVVWLQKRLRE